MSKFKSEGCSQSNQTIAVMAVLVCTLLLVAGALPGTAQQGLGVAIRGRVVNSEGTAVEDASVQLKEKGAAVSRMTKTDAAGAFTFADLGTGAYLLTAEKEATRSREKSVEATAPGQMLKVDLVLESAGESATGPAGADKAAAPVQAMQFADEPNFTVAGVTDWTAAGGHGSDSSLRTSEALTRETLKLKANGTGQSASKAGDEDKAAAEAESRLRTALANAPGSFDANHRLGKFYLEAGKYNAATPLLQAAYRIDPKNFDNEYDLALACRKTGDLQTARAHLRNLLAERNTGDLHRLAGEIDEESGDPLSAVHEFELAARLDPSEQNYFEWGSELLFHRAVLQARVVFEEGVKAYPKSSRMLTALGGTLFASALYDEAAQRLCDASDLNPANPEPYLFMGKIEIAAPNPLACVEQKLARFAQLQPQNSLANYFYAMAIWKQHEGSPSPQTLAEVETRLTRAVTLDPKCADAYLQLGNLQASRRDYAKAAWFYTHAIEANPQLSDAYYRLAVAYDRMGERAKAKQEFELHDAIKKQQAGAVEQQRREVKQFVVVAPAAEKQTKDH